MEEAKAEERFNESVLQIGREYFGEYLSELSRQRQGNLLLASVFAILLSYTFIKPTGGGIAGINVEILHVDALPLLAGAVTTYYLILYSIGVFQDWQYYFLRIGTTMDFQRRLEDELSEQRYANQDKIRAMLRKYHAEHPDLPEEAFTDVRNLPEHIQAELVKNNSVVSGLEFLEKTEIVFINISKLKLVVEIIFPVGLSLFAIGSAVWTGFFR